jgi:hypothetical protein
MSEVDVIQLIKDERARTGERLKECKDRLIREGRIPKPSSKPARLSPDRGARGHHRRRRDDRGSDLATRPHARRQGRQDAARSAAERLKPVLVEVLDQLP